MKGLIDKLDEYLSSLSPSMPAKETMSILISIGMCLLVFFIALGIVNNIRKKVRRSINRVSRSFQRSIGGAVGQSLNMGDLKGIAQQIKTATEQSEQTPLNISGGDALYLPRIMAESPDFNIEVAKQNVENAVASAMWLCGSKGDKEQFIKDYGEELYKSCYNRLINNYKGVSEVKIHNSALSGCRKNTTGLTAKFQVAFQVEVARDGNSSYKEFLQRKAEVEYVLSVKGDEGDNTVGVRCGHCGAPLEDVSSRTCHYCGNGIAVVMEQAWRVNRITVMS